MIQCLKGSFVWYTITRFTPDQIWYIISYVRFNYLRYMWRTPRSFLTVDLSSWRKKIEVELDGEESESEARVTLEEYDGSFIEHHQYHDGILTIGCCGQSFFKYVLLHFLKYFFLNIFSMLLSMYYHCSKNTQSNQFQVGVPGHLLFSTHWIWINFSYIYRA